MKRTAFFGMMLVLTGLAISVGCTGGGSSGTGNNAPAPTTATATISVVGTLPSGSTIGGLDLSLLLPAGVTVKSSANSLSAQVPDAGTVSASGVAVSNSQVYAVYTAAAAAAPAAVRILLANTAGFTAGECIVVTCDIAAGSTPAAADFSVSGIKFVDGDGKAIDGLSATVTAVLQ